MTSRPPVRRTRVRAAYIPSRTIDWGRDGVLFRSGDRQPAPDETGRAWPRPLRALVIAALGLASWAVLIATALMTDLL